MQKLKNLTILLFLPTLFGVVGNPSPHVLVSPGAVAPDLGSAATLVALAGSTLTNTGANLIGRLLSLNGALMMDTNSTPFPITNTQLFNFSYLPLNMK